MGIKGLIVLLRKHAPSAIKERKLSHYKGKNIGIDASIAVYEWCAAGVKHNIRNKEGKYINHVQGIFFRTLNMLEAGVIPVYIFDGVPPEAKAGVLAERRDAYARLRLPHSVFSECKRILVMMGVKAIEAPSEAEAQGAMMTQFDGLNAVATEDTDAIAFGAKLTLRNFNMLRKDVTVTEVDLDKVLAALKMTRASFVDLCILLGSDYTGTLPGIGPKRALELIQKYKSINVIMDRLQIMTPTSKFNYELARKEFHSPLVENREFDTHVRRLTLEEVQKLRAYLVEFHGLDAKRVDNGIARLKKLNEIED